MPSVSASLPSIDWREFRWPWSDLLHPNEEKKPSNDLQFEAEFRSVRVHFFDHDEMFRRQFSRRSLFYVPQLEALLHRSANFKTLYPRHKKGLPRDAREPNFLT